MVTMWTILLLCAWNRNGQRKSRHGYYIQSKQFEYSLKIMLDTSLTISQVFSSAREKPPARTNLAFHHAPHRVPDGLLLWDHPRIVSALSVSCSCNEWWLRSWAFFTLTIFKSMETWSLNEILALHHATHPVADGLRHGGHHRFDVVGFLFSCKCWILFTFHRGKGREIGNKEFA